MLSQILAAIREVAQEVPILVVGAQARDLLLLHAHGIDTIRATRDYDLAIAVEDWPHFNSLREALLTSGRFSATPGMLHQLRFEESVRVDIVPFAGVEDSAGAIAWPPGGTEVMSVLGFREALASSIEVRLPDDVQTRVVSLPALAVLKLIAWSERSAVVRPKDARDLGLLLASYEKAVDPERLYGSIEGMLERDDFDVEVAGAWLLGKDAANLFEGHHEPEKSTAFSPRAAGSQLARETLAKLLARETDDSGELALATEIDARASDRALRNIRAFAEGFGARGA